MCELLWSDPGPDPGRAPSKRGVGVAFGEDVTRGFLEQNGLKLLVRSHEVRTRALLFICVGVVSTRMAQAWPGRGSSSCAAHQRFDVTALRVLQQ